MVLYEEIFKHCIVNYRSQKDLPALIQASGSQINEG